MLVLVEGVSRLEIPCCDCYVCVRCIGPVLLLLMWRLRLNTVG
jgi:hypothetical protein